MKNKDEIQVDTILNIFRVSTLLSRIGGKLTANVGLTSVQQWMLLAMIEKMNCAPIVRHNLTNWIGDGTINWTLN